MRVSGENKEVIFNVAMDVYKTRGETKLSFCNISFHSFV